MATRRSRSIVLPLVALGALLILHQCWSAGQAYAVKGVWEGELSHIKDFAKGDFESLKGLEPSMDLPAISYYDNKGLELSVEGGRLNLKYQRKLGQKSFADPEGQGQTLQLGVNDAKAWRVGLTTQNADLHVRGQGPTLDGVYWEASQASTTGDVKVKFNSEGRYNLTISRDELATIAGAKLGGKVLIADAGVTGLLVVRHELSNGTTVTFSAENPVGVYNIGNSTCKGELGCAVAGGKASLKAKSDASGQEYSGSFTRDVKGGRANFMLTSKKDHVGYDVSFAHSLGKGAPANFRLGMDEAGTYGKLMSQRKIGEAIDAEYEATARFGAGTEQQLTQRLKMSSASGHAQLTHKLGSAPRLRLGYDFDAGAPAPAMHPDLASLR